MGNSTFPILSHGELMKNQLTTVNKLLLIDGLFEGGRMFVGATSVSYLLHSGLSLSNVALLKSIQAIVLILAELPTGIFADAMGRRLSLILSSCLSVLGFCLFIFGSGLTSFIAAESLTALSLCFWSGAYEAFAIDKGNLNDSTLDDFFHKNSTINSALVLIFGMLGGWLGSIGLQWPYLGAILAFITLIITLFHIETDKSLSQITSNNNKSWFQESLLSLKHQFKVQLNIIFSKDILSKGLLGFVLVQILVQFLVQPILHYWQPFFTSINTNISSIELGYIFATYSGTSVFSGIMASFLSTKKWFRTISSTWFLFALCSILYIILAREVKFAFAILFFALLQGILSMARTSLSARLNSRIPNNSRASVLSLISLLSRFGMITSLSLLAQFASPQIMFFRYSLIGFTILIFTALILITKFIKKETYNGHTKKIDNAGS